MAYLPTDGSGPDLQVYNPDPNQPTNTATGQPKTTGSQIEALYHKYLNRGASYDGDPTGATAWNSWSSMDPAAAEEGIKNSAEAQAYRQSQMSAQPSLSSAASAAPIASAQGTNPALTQLRNMLLSRAGQSLQVDPNDPTIKAQTDAYRADVTRGGRDFLTQQAEKGGPYGDMGAAYRSVAEKAGQAVADRRGQLMQGIVDARRKEIADSLSGLGGTLSLDEQVRLRQEDQDLARQRFGADTAQQTFENNYRTIFG